MPVLTSFQYKHIPNDKVLSSPKPEIYKWAVHKSSTLRIVGSSNVNKFACEIPGYNKIDTIFCPKDDAKKPVPLQGSLSIDVMQFDCHNKFLTNDLRKTVKADKYPLLVVRFLSLTRAPLITQNRDQIMGIVEVELAGKTKRFELAYSFVKNENAQIELTSSRVFYFSDFELTPPRKLGGLIKVNDIFNVDFRLILIPL